MVDEGSTCEIEVESAHAQAAARAGVRLATTHPHLEIREREGGITITGRAIELADMRIAWKSALLTELEHARAAPEREELLLALFA